MFDKKLALFFMLSVFGVQAQGLDLSSQVCERFFTQLSQALERENIDGFQVEEFPYPQTRLFSGVFIKADHRAFLAQVAENFGKVSRFVREQMKESERVGFLLELESIFGQDQIPYFLESLTSFQPLEKLKSFSVAELGKDSIEQFGKLVRALEKFKRGELELSLNMHGNEKKEPVSLVSSWNQEIDEIENLEEGFFPIHELEPYIKFKVNHWSWGRVCQIDSVEALLSNSINLRTTAVGRCHTKLDKLREKIQSQKTEQTNWFEKASGEPTIHRASRYMSAGVDVATSTTCLHQVHTQGLGNLPERAVKCSKQVVSSVKEVPGYVGFVVSRVTPAHIGTALNVLSSAVQIKSAISKKDADVKSVVDSKGVENFLEMAEENGFLEKLGIKEKDGKSRIELAKKILIDSCSPFCSGFVQKKVEQTRECGCVKA